MAIRVECKACGGRFRALDRLKGKSALCPKCRRPLVIAGEWVRNHDVFVSYAHRDKQTAEATCAALEKRHLRCWIAPRDVTPGADWGAEIIDALENSRVMVLIVSADANKSPQVKREVERAANKDVQIIPVRIDDLPMSKSLEYFLSACHWLDAFTPPFDQHLKKLVAAVEKFLSPPLVAPPGNPVIEPPVVDDNKNERPTDRWSRTKLAAVGAALCMVLTGVLWIIRLGNPTPPVPSGDKSSSTAAVATSNSDTSTPIKPQKSLEEEWAAKINDACDKADRQMPVNPSAAAQELKSVLTELGGAPKLSDAARKSLQEKLTDRISIDPRLAGQTRHVYYCTCTPLTVQPSGKFGGKSQGDSCWKGNRSAKLHVLSKRPKLL